MKKTIHKFFGVWAFEKEEQWLNEMAQKGLHLCDVGFCRYTFEAGAPGAYVYRMELLDNWLSHEKSVQYIQFLEDTGAEKVGSLTRWVYFRKKAGDHGFDLFSDVRSRIRHLDRILWMTALPLWLNLFNTINCASNWWMSGLWGNRVIILLCATATLLLGYGFFRLLGMRNRLKKELRLHE